MRCRARRRSRVSIPTTFFHTTARAAPKLGVVGALFVLGIGLLYLDRRRRRAAQAGEEYGEENQSDSPSVPVQPTETLTSPLSPAFLPHAAGRSPKSGADAGHSGHVSAELADFAQAGVREFRRSRASKLFALWAVEEALLAGILCIVFFALRHVRPQVAGGFSLAIGEHFFLRLTPLQSTALGCDCCAARLHVDSEAMSHTIANPLLSAAVTTTVLAGVTGSAFGADAIVWQPWADSIFSPTAAQEFSEILHRVTGMASGGMDTLPHNGAVITLLAVTALTQSVVVSRHLCDDADQDRSGVCGDRVLLPDSHLH